MHFLLFLFFSISAQTKAEAILFVHAVQQQLGITKLYNPRYAQLSYPNGDVPQVEGVCTDVIIRGLRKLRIDLQKNIHEDMQRNFKQYPQKWGLKGPNKNIDHRRVPNMVTYFQRKGLEVSLQMPYLPGDIVVWDLGSGFLHIGVMSNQYERHGKRYKVIHNICCGVQEEDFLHEYPILHHFRLPRSWLNNPS